MPEISRFFGIDVFARVRIDSEVPVPVWPNDIDLSPERLYNLVIKEKLSGAS